MKFLRKFCGGKDVCGNGCLVALKQFPDFVN